MEEAPRPKKKKTKDKKVKRKRAEERELQERASLSSPEAEHEPSEIAETAFRTGEPVEEVESFGAIARNPLNRSDSELTSIVVVGDDEENRPIKLKKEESLTENQPIVSDVAEIGVVSKAAEEAATSPRRKATLSRLDSAASLIKEETSENVRFLQQDCIPCYPD